MSRLNLLPALLLVSANALACNDNAPYTHLRLAAGEQGMWLKDDNTWDDNGSGIAAIIRLNHSRPAFGTNWVRWDIELEHHSHWNSGWPYNDDSEDELDSITFGLQFRLEP